ncbi:MAG TPA: hypothetical protein VFT91_09130 [Dehalococcoidia bacterium]|nr:hypothetical protein [Dehalococcoidia bacterium]
MSTTNALPAKIAMGAALLAALVLALPAPAPSNAYTDPITGVHTITTAGGRLDWSRSLNLIAFDRLGPDGFYDVYTMRPDGSDQVCVTCSNPTLPGKHMGNPTWHPSGKYIAFQAEKPTHSGTSTTAKPGLGLYNDLWLITADGSAAWKLVDNDPNRVLLHPQFSHDGTKLAWAQNVTNLGAAIRVADFVVDGSGPHLENIRNYLPVGHFLYETHGFSSDDTKIIFSATADGQPAWSLDIYTLDLVTGAVASLTASLDQWDEHAQFTPSDQKVVWMSSTDCGCDPSRPPLLKTDLWLMNADGSGKTRLTHFSDKTSPDYQGFKVVAGDMSWGPDSKSLAVRLMVGPKETIVIVEFSQPQ